MFIERFIKFLCASVIAFLLCYGGYSAFMLYFWKGVYDSTPVQDKTITVVSEDGQTKEILYKKQQLSGDPFVVLLLGVDSNDMSSGRSDTILLAVVDPKIPKISLLSVPRDTYITNQATGKEDKITHAYNKGASNTIASLEEYFNIPIDYYAAVNFEGFAKVIDAIGGITINVDHDIRFNDRITGTNFEIKKGTQKLNGIQALNYARYRGDADGDFGRNRRQREVIQAIIHEAASFKTVTKINELLDILSDNFKTSAKSSDIPYFVTEIVSANPTIEELEMKARPARVGKASVVKVDEADKQKTINELHRRLGLLKN